MIKKLSEDDRNPLKCYEYVKYEDYKFNKTYGQVIFIGDKDIKENMRIFLIFS